jgi:proline racemase
VEHRIRTIDAHVGGQPVRLILDGADRSHGRAAAWPRHSSDHLGRAVVLEPRGQQDLTAVVLTGPLAPGAHAGLLFFDADGPRAVSGHGIIAAATIAIERRLVPGVDSGAAELRLVFDTPAGRIQTLARIQDRGGSPRVDAMRFTGLPSFVHTPGHTVVVDGRHVRVDLAFGGLLYAIVDTESIGIPLDGTHLPELRRLGARIGAAIDGLTHPADASAMGAAGVLFTAPPRDAEAHLRNVVVTGSGIVNRSPSGTGTAAVMAVLDAMGLLPADLAFVHESLTGALFRGRVVRRTLVGDLPALIPEIEGTAWITGEHTFYVDEDDPLRDGFVL